MNFTPAMARQIEMWSLERLTPYARNARTHSDAQIAQIASSIVEFGFTAPLLVSSDGGILAGHGRLAAAKKLGLDVVPVVVIDHLTPTQRRAYILADNQLALAAGWNEELLASELADLSGLGFDLTLTGFSDDELADLLGDEDAQQGTPEELPIGNSCDTSDDDIPDAPDTPASQVGDIWQLGAHRLICGDSTDPAVVAALMTGEQASLCFTSPPYGQQRNYTQGIADWDALMRGVFANLPMAGDGQVLVNLGLIHRDNEFIPYWDGWLAWMRKTGWRRFGWYVWDQGPGLPGDWNGRLAPAFEFVFHFNRQSRQANKIVPCKFAGQETHLRKDGSSTAMRKADGTIGGWTAIGAPTQDTKIPDSVIRVMRHKGRIGQDIDHPAVFPVALPEHILLAYSNPGDMVFEPFCGSGSTILAAQKTHRVARAIELASEYTDVTVKRFQQNHPDIPVTLVATGQTFAEVTAERELQREEA